jgi:hypothetical protein
MPEPSDKVAEVLAAILAAIKETNALLKELLKKI